MNLHFAFVLAILFTLGVSAFCSVMEAMILSTTTAEIEALKKKNPRKGQLLERFKIKIEETISTILTVNTLANTLGATLVGGLAMRLFGNHWLAIVSGGLALAILVFSEIIPKNVGVAYRVPLQAAMVYPLQWMIAALRPVTYLSNMLVRGLIRGKPQVSDSDEEILLLAQKGAKDGRLTKNEMDMIANALSLDNIRVSEIMTPRTVVTALDESLTVGEVFRQYRNIPFGRMPVYAESIDEVVGLVRRRDLLQSMANGEEQKLVRDLKQEVHFIPETVTAAAALQIFLKTHQQLSVVVDEFGSVAGVVTMEDIMEHIIGREIFEKDDLAIDMRELARARHLMMKKRQQVKSEASVTH
jgi:CBS domain containing-hemolysin-like protein